VANFQAMATLFANMEDSDLIETCHGWYPAFKEYCTATHNIPAEVRVSVCVAFWGRLSPFLGCFERRPCFS